MPRSNTIFGLDGSPGFPIESRKPVNYCAIVQCPCLLHFFGLIVDLFMSNENRTFTGLFFLYKILQECAVIAGPEE